MIVQDIYLPKYEWHVRVYYAVTTYWAERIIADMERIGCRGEQLRKAYANLRRGELDTGITYSNFKAGKSVMVISLTSTPAQFLNSWLHESRHLSRHIEQACGISPYGEEAAYLAGDIGQRMFPVAKNFICEHCRKKLNVMGKEYIDILIENADGMKYCDFCRLLSVIYWNMGTE